MALILRFIFCATLLHALSVHDGIVFAKAPDGEGPSEVDKIREQVSKLNAPDFTTRDEAFRFLKGREKAIPLLRLAAESKDLEGAKRAKSLLSASLNARYQRLLSEVLAKGEEAELDLLVELIGARRQPLSDKERESDFSIARALLAHGTNPPLASSGPTRGAAVAARDTRVRTQNSERTLA